MQPFQNYAYHPSLAAAIIFIILFGAVTTLQAFQLLRKRTWFMVPFLIGGILEVCGYIGRAISASENPGPYAKGPYILQSITLLVAPALFAASIYMELGRIVLMLRAEKSLFIRRTWLTKIFVGGDVASFLLQASGAGSFASSNPKTSNSGKNIIVGGLLVQIIFFGLFVIATAIFHRCMRKNPTQEVRELPWLKHLYSLYIVSILIFLRSIVRVVEFAQGFHGYIYTHEAFLYVFDATLMWFAMFAMSYVHPGEVADILRREKQDQAGELSETLM